MIDFCGDFNACRKDLRKCSNEGYKTEFCKKKDT
jgi:hypothetical protein